MLKWALVPLGIITAIVLTMPALVIVGLIFLIIPGLILALIPTVFVYLLATQLIRSSMRMEPSLGSTGISFVLALVLGYLVMIPMRSREQRKFDEANLADIIPADKINLTGAVLVDFASGDSSNHQVISCDSLCLALLDTPGVTSVTRQTPHGSATFRLGSNKPGELILPHDPEKILLALSKISDERKPRRLEDVRSAERAVQAFWGIRIAKGDELRRSQPLTDEQIDWTVHYERVHERDQPKIDRLEIIDRNGTVVYRKSWVLHAIPTLMFHFGFEGGSSANGFQGARFVLGTSTVSNLERRHYDFDPTAECLRAAYVQEPRIDKSSSAEMERALIAALDNPKASKTQLLLAPMWLGQFHYNADKNALPTIARILLDDRIDDQRARLEHVFSSRLDLSSLRAGLVKRCLAINEPKQRGWYIRTLTEMPDGTFVNPTDDERMMWSDALEQHEFAPFLARIADRGESAVPELLDVLERVLPKPWHARWQVLDGLRSGFKRLGPSASAAIPQITSLLERSPSPLTNSSGDVDEWLLTLHLMGVPVEDIPFHRHLQPGQKQKEMSRIAKQAVRYTADRARKQK